MGTLPWSLNEMARLTAGALRGEGDVVPDGVYIDSREDGAGRLFVAIKGERFNGHDFVAAAVRGGASAVLVERNIPDPGTPTITVKDSLRALQQLGAARRALFPGPVLAVTGSSGKTTTRSILAALVSTAFSTHQPRKNFNNHIGVPLTLLELDPGVFGAAIVELGCSDFNEIALLADLSRPDVGVITNVGPAHLEKLIDLEGVARAKGELFAGLDAGASTVINLDDPMIATIPTVTDRVITFSMSLDADVRLLERRPMGVEGQLLRVSYGGEIVEASLPLPGEHNAMDALAACAASMAVGITGEQIARGMSVVPRSPGRLDLVEGPSGSLVLDDSYNANPASMAAALRVLVEMSAGGRAIAILADMLELGAASDRAHREIGEKAAAAGLELLVTMGEGGRLIAEGAIAAGFDEERLSYAKSHLEAARMVSEILRSNDALLIKGSRGMGMERVVFELSRGLG